MPPTNGHIDGHISSRLNDTFTFQCNKGFSPLNIIIQSKCTEDAVWTPNPLEHICDLIKLGK